MSDNPFTARLARIGSVGRKSERKTATRLKGKVTPASGAAIKKGDVVLPKFLLEAKSTVKASLGLQHDWLVKISEEAMFVGKAPALSVTFTDANGSPVRYGKWVMVPESEFNQLQLIAQEVE